MLQDLGKLGADLTKRRNIKHGRYFTYERPNPFMSTYQPNLCAP